MSQQVARQTSIKPICYIDDSRTSAYVTKKLLKQYGYAVEHYSEAEAALEALMINEYSLLITDLIISDEGGMNGDDLINIIRQSGHPVKSQLPIIVVTGAGDKETHNALLTAGANEVLQKPLSGKLLHEAIEPLLQNSTSSADMDEVEPTRVTPIFSKNSQQPELQAEPIKPSVEEKISREASPVSPDMLVNKPATTRDKWSQIADIVEQEEPPVSDVSRQTIDSDAFQSRPKADTAAGQLDSGAISSRPQADPDLLHDTDTRSSEAEKIAEQDAERKKAKMKEEAFDIPVLTSAVDSTYSDPAESEKQNTGGSKSKSEGANPGEDNSLIALLDHLEGGEEEQPAPKAASKSHVAVPNWVAKIFIPALVLFLIIPASVFWYLGQKVISVHTITMKPAPIHSEISVPGRIISQHKIKVSAQEPGQVVKVLVKDGNTVKKGQVMVNLDETVAMNRIKQAQARLLSIEEEVSRASKTQERLQRALDMGAVSRQMVEDAESVWKTASAQESVIEEELSAAEIKLEQLRIKAPFDGVVTTVYVQQGQWLSQADAILMLVDMEKRVIDLNVDASDSGSLTMGQSVAISSDAFDGKVWMEKIVKIGSEAQNKNAANVVTVQTSLGKEAPALRIGQQVDAEIRTESRGEVSTLPVDTVFTHDGTPHVATIENGKVVFLPVNTGIESVSHIEILSGLRENQEVIVLKDLTLEEGRKAVPVNQTALPSGTM